MACAPGPARASQAAWNVSPTRRRQDRGTNSPRLGACTTRSPAQTSATSTAEHPLVPQIREALHRVDDPEIRRPITDLGMVDDIEVDAAGRARRTGTADCRRAARYATRCSRDVTAAVLTVPGVTAVDVELGVMSDEQRAALRELLKGGQADREIPFARPDSLTQVIAVASGKGGVGKSSVTVNLARALAAHGRKVGVLDADIYGHSVPAMLGVADSRPTAVEDMIMPVPAARLKVISIGMLKPRRDQVVAWRGPILDRALTQMLADVYWGDLDYLLIDLPPGTGDVAISLGQKLPNAEVLVVTTPQAAAAEVAERAGTMASMMNQHVIGVVENMSHLVTTCPHCGEVHTYDVFGTGGGADVARTLSTRLGYAVTLLAQIPTRPAAACFRGRRRTAGRDRPRPARRAGALSSLADTLAQARSWAPRQATRPTPADGRRRCEHARAARPNQVASRSKGVSGRAREAPSMTSLWTSRAAILAGVDRIGDVCRRVVDRLTDVGDLGLHIGDDRLHVVEEVLLHEGLRVQVTKIEVLEFRPQLLAQLLLGRPSRRPQVAHQPCCLTSKIWQSLRTEQDDGDHQKQHELGSIDVEQQGCHPQPSLPPRVTRA